MPQSGSNTTSQSGSNTTSRSGSNTTSRSGSNTTSQSGSNTTSQSGFSTIAQKKVNSSIQVDNAKLTTSITFVSICFAIIIFLKKFPISNGLDNSIMFLICFSILSFIACAFYSYIAMTKNSIEDGDLMNEIFSAKSISYFVAIVVFVISAFLVVYNA